MRDLRNHPFILAVELGLVVTLVAVVLAHIRWQERLYTSPRAFEAPISENALIERYRPHEAVFVNAELSHLGVVVTDEDGLRAVEAPAASAAHIFTLHPEDRRAQWEATPGPDFFLDDPHETGGGCLERLVSLSPSGNEVVYVIDGNLWVHDDGALGFELVSDDGAPVKVTFVVRGDIFLLDDVRAEGGSVAFLALPSVALFGGGGDIHLGDVEYGTLAHVDGYLFAARDVQVRSLRETTVVHGALAAGRRVDVEPRSRARLEVRFDPRLAHRVVAPPGL